MVSMNSEDWQNLFDLITVHAGKGGFFSSIQPFRRLTPAKDDATEVVRSFGLSNEPLVGGNAHAVQVGL